MVDEYIGVVGRSHGLDGTVVLVDAMSLPQPLAPGTRVGIGFSRDFVTMYTVAEFSATPHRTTLRLQEFSTAEAIATLTDQAVYASSGDVGVDDADRHRIGDIEGCTVVTTDNELVGTITDVWLMPANDVWVVTAPDGSTIPLPVIDDVIKHVDIAHRRVTIDLLPGLRDITRTTADENDA
jgi:16S rRNA processing protein RimM